MADEDSASASASQTSDAPPPLVALFLIKFDLKVGYTISWKQSLPSIPLEGVVEYKSLPSGLHNVRSDLVYFVHEQEYAGVSAFQNVEASAGERNARFISVGALVRLGDGRLGRAWEHASALKELAEQVVGDTQDVGVLEEYWERWRSHGDGQKQDEARTAKSPVSQRGSRALSSLTLGGSSAFQQRLPPYHPAYSILGYLDTFGPLAFPLHRMALLRKRVLVITPVPVKAPCEYVYNLSIFSSLPHSLQYTPPSSSLVRLRPLFNLGIHDIPYLTDLSKSNADSSDTTSEESSGWIACTTDEILAMKTDLYDVLVELPHPDRLRPSSKRGRKPKNKGSGASRWPVIRLGGSGEEIKASQRDLRRYRSLRRALTPLTKLESGQKSEEHLDVDEDDEEAHLLFNSVHETFTDEGEEELQHRQDEEQVTEKASWSELAYSSFMWWASAGEREEGLKAEDDQDAALLVNLHDVVRKEVDRREYRDEASDDDDDETDQERRPAEIEMAVIAYFHRVTKSLFENAEAALEQDVRPVPSQAINEDDEDDGNQSSVRLESEDLRLCGLDVWSERDRLFIIEFVDLWFERDASVRGAGVECCGMRIC